jgi:hypothetical protein
MAEVARQQAAGVGVVAEQTSDAIDDAAAAANDDVSELTPKGNVDGGDGDDDGDNADGDISTAAVDGVCSICEVCPIFLFFMFSRIALNVCLLLCRLLMLVQRLHLAPKHVVNVPL